MTFPTHLPEAEVFDCVHVCAFARAHLSQLCLRVKGRRLRKGERREEPWSLPNVFPGCVTARRGWAGQREVPSRNRESDVSCYTPPLEEEGKRKEGEEVKEEEEEGEAGASVLQRH